MAHYSFTENDLDLVFDQYKNNMLTENWVLVKDETITNASNITRELVFSEPAGAEPVAIGFYLSVELDSYSVTGYTKSGKISKGAEISLNVCRTWNPALGFRFQTDIATNLNQRIDMLNLVNTTCELNITNERIIFNMYDSDYYYATFMAGRYRGYGDNLTQPYTFFIDINSTSLNTATYYFEDYVGNENKLSDDPFLKRDMIRNNDGSISLFEDILYYEQSGYAYGTIDGYYLLTGDAVQARQTFNVGSDQFIILPFNYLRTSQEKSFFAVKTN